MLVLVLVGGTTAAFAVTERLKLERSPITAPEFDRRFSPTCGCETRIARLSITFRKSDSVDALIVDRDDEVVRTLASDQDVGEGEETFTWDGRDDAGSLVPDGKYRLRLHLERSRRTFVIPTQVLVDTKLPKVRILDVSRKTISPDGDGRNERVKVVYRAGKKGRPILLVDGEVVVRGKARPAGKAAVQWNGRIGGAAATAGEHRLSLQVRDRAGNLSKPTEPVIVRVRYIELAQDVITVRRGGLLRFRVVTDALPFRWTLMSKDRSIKTTTTSSTNVVEFRLAKNAPLGRFPLQVEVNGHTDEGVVVVTKAAR